jgi:hypothetical protein
MEGAMQTPEEVLVMRQLLERGWSRRRIAAEPGISRNTLPGRLLRIEKLRQRPQIKAARRTNREILRSSLSWLKQTGSSEILFWKQIWPRSSRVGARFIAE